VISSQEIIVRLLTAVVLCGAVGFQRALTGKAAGMRTHILTGVGAALFTLVSAYAFHGLASADRIAAQVVSGIGFIGGGAILKERGSIRGLTTAAGLWASAALGMAAGAGMYFVGALGAAIILTTLVTLRRIELRFPRRSLDTWLAHITLQDDATQAQIDAVLAAAARRSTVIALGHDHELRLTYSIDLPRQTNVMELSGRLRTAGAASLTWEMVGGPEGSEGP
jgi:putative Mg2+ transporter-C (MgtC) family protein